MFAKFTAMVRRIVRTMAASLNDNDISKGERAGGSF